MEGPFTIRSSPEVEAGVMGSAVVVAAQRKAVVEVGGSARHPREALMMDLAPGERALATGHRTGVVDQRQGTPLGAGVESPELAEVEGHRVTVEDGRDETGVARQPPGLAGRDGDGGVEPGDAETCEQSVEVDPDQQLAPVGGMTAGRQVLDELAPGCAAGLVDVRALVVAGRGLVDHRVTRPIAGQPSR
jgi:hypothetical protein